MGHLEGCSTLPIPVPTGPSQGCGGHVDVLVDSDVDVARISVKIRVCLFWMEPFPDHWGSSLIVSERVT